MSHQVVVSIGTRSSEAALLRRLTKVWLTTGAVPVAHMVADLDDLVFGAAAEQSLEIARRTSSQVDL